MRRTERKSDILARAAHKAKPTVVVIHDLGSRWSLVHSVQSCSAIIYGVGCSSVSKYMRRDKRSGTHDSKRPRLDGWSVHCENKSLCTDEQRDL